MLIENQMEAPEKVLERARPDLLYGPGAKEAILEALVGSDPDRVLAFLLSHQGKNQETGFKKFCPTCNDYTGTVVLPLDEWYFEMCLRKPQIRAWKVLIRRLPPFGRAVLIPPGMSAKDVLALVLRVVEPGYFTRCAEIWMGKKILERERTMIAEMKAEAVAKTRASVARGEPPAAAGGGDAKRVDFSRFDDL